MEKRYQVFISSTYLDLKEERLAVQAAVLKMGWFPAGMELFTATNRTPLELIKQIIDNCDFYVVVSAARYGSIIPQGTISYTEAEFDYAVSKKKHILGFIRSNIASVPPEKKDSDPRVFDSLMAFHEKVRVRNVAYWETQDRLELEVYRALNVARNDTAALGWFHGSDAVDPTIAERLRKENAELQRKVLEATTTPPPGLEKLQQGSDSITVTVKYQRRGMIWQQSGTSHSWDQIFGWVGAKLIAPLERERLSRQLAQAIVWFLFGGDSNIVHESAILNPSDFETIVIQLIALNLIKPAEGHPSRLVLTLYGEHYLVSLKARKR